MFTRKDLEPSVILVITLAFGMLIGGSFVNGTRHHKIISSNENIWFIEYTTGREVHFSHYTGNMLPAPLADSLNIKVTKVERLTPFKERQYLSLTSDNKYIHWCSDYDLVSIDDRQRVDAFVSMYPLNKLTDSTFVNKYSPIPIRIKQ